METRNLSEAAMAVLRRRWAQEWVEVTDQTRPLYRDLARAGLMRAGSTFRDGEESIYRLTSEGFERKAELCGCARDSA